MNFIAFITFTTLINLKKLDCVCTCRLYNAARFIWRHLFVLSLLLLMSTLCKA